KAQRHFAPGQDQNEHRQNDGRKEASRRKLHHERGERRQDCQHPLHHQVAFVRAKRFIFPRPTSSPLMTGSFNILSYRPAAMFETTLLTGCSVIMQPPTVFTRASLDL